MNDMLEQIYEALLTSDYIKEQTRVKNSDEYRIKPYLYPETGDKSGPFITIRPYKVQDDAYFGSDEELAINFGYQIDVEGVYRSTVKQLQFEVKKALKTIKFRQIDGGMDEYFKETKRYVDARRYTGNSNIYKTNY